MKDPNSVNVVFARKTDQSFLHADFWEFPVSNLAFTRKWRRWGKNIPLCPFMGFSQTARLSGHIKLCREKGQNWPGSGFRPPRLALAFHNSDMSWQIRTPSLPMGNCIAPSSSIFREQVMYVLSTRPNNTAFFYDAHVGPIKYHYFYGSH